MCKPADVLLVAGTLVLLSCDAPTEPSTVMGNQAVEAAYSIEDPQAMRGGPKPKPQPNPIGCSQEQVAKWDEAEGKWVCADDLVGGTGLGEHKWLLAYGFMDDTETVV